MPEEKKEAILARRLQNDSKCGGRSRTSIMSKGPQRWDNHDGDDDGGMKNKWYLSISLNLCFVVCFLQILYFLWGWIQIYFFCRLYTFGFNYTFYISCEVGLKHTFLDTGWALTEALADLIESVLTAASVLTKMRMGQDTLKMISENSLDLLFCNIYTVVEKRTLTLLQCSVRPNYAICQFLGHRYWNLNAIPVQRYLINYKDISFYERHIYLPRFEEAGFVPPWCDDSYCTTYMYQIVCFKYTYLNKAFLTHFFN